MFSKNLIADVNYIVVIITVTLLLILLFVFDQQKNIKELLFSLSWVIVGSIMHALLIYLLYQTSFPLDESIRLASFERYLNTFIVSVVYLLLFVMANYRVNNKLNTSLLFCLTFFICINGYNNNKYEQVMPGYISMDEQKNSFYIETSNRIINLTSLNDSVFIVSIGDNGSKLTRFKYYLHPRYVLGTSSIVVPNISYSYDEKMPKEELIKVLEEYDYIYFDKTDDSFFERYDCFDKTSNIIDGNLYKLKIMSGEISLILID